MAMCAHWDFARTIQFTGRTRQSDCSTQCLVPWQYNAERGQNQASLLVRLNLCRKRRRCTPSLAVRLGLDGDDSCVELTYSCRRMRESPTVTSAVFCAKKRLFRVLPGLLRIKYVCIFLLHEPGKRYACYLSFHVSQADFFGAEVRRLTAKKLFVNIFNLD